MGKLSHKQLLGGLILSLILSVSAQGLEVGDEATARKNLAEKLLKLGRSLDMREASYAESAGAGGQSFNRNDGNSFTSNSTYHSNVWSRCLEWVGGQFCNKWLDPYVSIHGLGEDKSPIEELVAKEWNTRKSDKESFGRDYGIWEVERAGGGSNLDADGKFDMKGLSDWRLKGDIREQAEKIGTDTAVRQIASTYDEDSPAGSETLPNMESLRLMASRWTKMFRNRLVASIGESRAYSAGTEAALGEDMASCDAYGAGVEADKQVTGIQERIQAQSILTPDSQASSIRRRVAQCKALRAASVYAVNPQTKNGNLVQGNANEEQIDQWKMRLNIAAIDSAGADISSLPKPGFGKIRPEDLTAPLKEYNAGGLTYNVEEKSNRQVLESYNQQLAAASAALKAASERNPNLIDNSAGISKFKIEAGTMSAARINDLTPEMRIELEGTGFPRTDRGDPSDPTLNLEETPAELAKKVGGE